MTEEEGRGKAVGIRPSAGLARGRGAGPSSRQSDARPAARAPHSKYQTCLTGTIQPLRDLPLAAPPHPTQTPHPLNFNAYASHPNQTRKTSLVSIAETQTQLPSASIPTMSSMSCDALLFQQTQALKSHSICFSASMHLK